MARLDDLDFVRRGGVRRGLDLLGATLGHLGQKKMKVMGRARDRKDVHATFDFRARAPCAHQRRGIQQLDT